MTTIKDLTEFIDTATRNRKYPPSTSQGLKAAVKLFDAELNDDERGSLDKLKSNLNQIYQTVYNKNKNNFTASSLATYRSRLLKVIADYEKYGVDPTKLANWTPKTVVRSPKQTSSKAVDEHLHDEVADTIGSRRTVPADMHNIELVLRPNTTFTLVLPRDLRKQEATTLKAILDSLVVTEAADEGSDVEPLGH